MENRKEIEKRVLAKADLKWEKSGYKIPDATRERVKRKFYAMVNAPDTMRGLTLVKSEAKIDKWINKLFEGAQKLVKKGVD